MNVVSAFQLQSYPLAEPVVHAPAEVEKVRCPRASETTGEATPTYCGRLKCVWGEC